MPNDVDKLGLDRLGPEGYEAGWDAITGRYYDRSGHAISMRDWCTLFENKDYQVVKQDTAHGCLVSTVWLGMDLNFVGNGFPIIFETMIFAEETELDQDTERYGTESEALRGHQVMIDRVVRALG